MKRTIASSTAVGVVVMFANCIYWAETAHEIRNMKTELQTAAIEISEAGDSVQSLSAHSRELRIEILALQKLSDDLQREVEICRLNMKPAVPTIETGSAPSIRVSTDHRSRPVSLEPLEAPTLEPIDEVPSAWRTFEEDPYSSAVQISINEDNERTFY